MFPRISQAVSLRDSDLFHQLSNVRPHNNPLRYTLALLVSRNKRTPYMIACCSANRLFNAVNPLLRSKEK